MDPTPLQHGKVTRDPVIMRMARRKATTTMVSEDSEEQEEDIIDFMKFEPYRQAAAQNPLLVLAKFKRP
jgi:hypothetical protein